MKRVISFSLWGSNPTYNVGAIKNAEIALTMYPNFECWFYIHKETVPERTVNSLVKLKNTKIIFKYGDLSILKPMTWRFESIDVPEVEINMSRDTDTRILLREKLAVDEWINSGKTFHIMRDHPHHNFQVLGGMFGVKKYKELSCWNELIKNYSNTQRTDYDQAFLADVIYPVLKNDSYIHSTFHKYENEVIHPFPIPYCSNWLFVGGYVYQDESTSLRHINDLKKGIQLH